MTDAYRALLDRLFAARRAGIMLGLERVREVLARLDHPERRLGQIAHIGGTNGKGSTAAMVAALARYAGKKTALYTSPHLASLRERFVIDGEPAGEDAVVAAAAKVAAAGGDALTFFEQVTLTAFVLFADAGVELSVIEVGLGGRLDATNVLEADVAAVTGVAMDHEAMLGKTLREIAAEKAGIWKPGQRAIIGMSGEPEAVPWLRAAAATAGVGWMRIIEPIDVARAPLPALLGEH
ncbi:MAG: bifunctional folylpolyglutamate synthase/dihydrofolate synthase, partial [Deltaproteobacteria bacterium]|nr:bifunctional folylpolyglutamate synthase/dihydrofolate synthase [Kofleriaceae bacterium]